MVVAGWAVEALTRDGHWTVIADSVDGARIESWSEAYTAAVSGIAGIHPDKYNETWRIVLRVKGGSK